MNDPHTNERELLLLLCRTNDSSSANTYHDREGVIDSRGKKKMDRDDLVFKAKLAEQAERYGVGRVGAFGGGFRIFLGDDADDDDI